jgi:hypothetical protein
LCDIEGAGVVDKDDLFGGSCEVVDESRGFEDGLVGVVVVLLNCVEVQWAEALAEKDLL